MQQRVSQYTRFCPNEPKIPISDAVCLGRRRSHYPYCPGCQFNDDEKKAAASAGGAARVQETTRMLDAIFKAYDVRGTVPNQLNEDLAYKIGQGTAMFLQSQLRGVERGDPDAARLILGRDMRKSGPALCAAFSEGARAAGSAVVNIGMIDTPQVYFAVNHLRCAGGVQTTASHNPGHYNGFKISGRGGAPVGSDTGLADIKRLAQTVVRRDEAKAPVSEIDLTAPYKAFVRGFLHPPRPMRVVVDASNGMAGKWAPILFGDLDALDVTWLNLEHNGEFVHEPNPLVEANLRQLRDEVRRIGADFGVCFDGDADRLILVDEHAAPVRCDLLTALLAREFLRTSPGATVVYDLRSSRVVAEEIRSAGGRPRRERVGHAFMKKALSETKGVFGGELSGHFYFRDNWFCDSGMLAFAHVLNVLTREGKPLGELLAPLKRYAASGERNFENEDKDGAIQRLAERFKDARVDFVDGITVQYETWWFNVRKSNTEPLLRLNLEAATPELLAEKLNLIAKDLGKPVEH
ncbi:MAG: phosphomannomutase/phosphoglucomutase [Phycisphaerae bacterium]|nr:MAG: phosphomannomutase/phosphoglucomutase [Planctomycetota bacterium]KAB2945437.1 MAG: phosphomannomutase/phosphoglucomutase [Phycisphaerae bacterium]MBE7458144.1 phosphomannomutase/phosphoglucomutase [Planctomycetia bacterium]MCK6464390.1 phosphomannomutase/phosphoglucomutase [Phycisphaerae bacterium]MCL4718058.1 phosphomannomutase/phosphoglucomutase [Phycisphaerae bacterium]